MKQIIRNISIIMLTAVFFAASAGISFFIHECSSSKTREVVAFPEITNGSVSCSCDREAHGQIHSEAAISSFNEPPCCKNTHVYLKASFTGFPVFYKFSDKAPEADIPVDLPVPLLDEDVLERLDVTPFYDHPPPLSGKTLIHFLHQIKIPASLS